MKIVSDIMTRNPACCMVDDNLVTAAKLMAENDCGEIPVIYNSSDKKVLGVITDRDICTRAIALGLDPHIVKVGECMSRPPIIVKESTTVEDCCLVMEQNKIRRLPVVDSEENCCGIISIADISNSQLSELALDVVKVVSHSEHQSTLH